MTTTQTEPDTIPVDDVAPRTLAVPDALDAADRPDARTTRTEPATLAALIAAGIRPVTRWADRHLTALMAAATFGTPVLGLWLGRHWSPWAAAALAVPLIVAMLALPIAAAHALWQETGHDTASDAAMAWGDRRVSHRSGVRTGLSVAALVVGIGCPTAIYFAYTADRPCTAITQNGDGPITSSTPC
jgi:hypothetical protein